MTIAGLAPAIWAYDCIGASWSGAEAILTPTAIGGFLAAVAAMAAEGVKVRVSAKRPADSALRPDGERLMLSYRVDDPKTGALADALAGCPSDLVSVPSAVRPADVYCTPATLGLCPSPPTSSATALISRSRGPFTRSLSSNTSSPARVGPSCEPSCGGPATAR